MRYVSNEPWREQLLNAVRHIQRHGWTRGQAVDLKTTACCAVGAIYMSNALDVGPGSSVTVAIKQLKKYVGAEVAVWNDSDGMTQERVVSTMKACAERVR